MVFRRNRSSVQVNWLKGIITLSALLGLSSLVAGCGSLLDQFSGPSGSDEDPMLLSGTIVAQSADATFTQASNSEKIVKLNKLMKHSAFRKLRTRLENEKGLKVHTEKARALKIHHKKQSQASGARALDTTSDDGTLLLVPVGEADQGYIADVNYQDQNTIWAETYDGGNLNYLDSQDELTFIYPEPEAKQQFLNEMQQDSEYQQFLGQLSSNGLSAENVQVIFDPVAMDAYLSVDAVTTMTGAAQGQALVSGIVSVGQYAIRKPLSSLQNRDGGQHSTPANPVLASPALVAPTVIGRPADVLVNAGASGDQFCLLQGGYTTGTAVYGRASCYSQSLKNYLNLMVNPPAYYSAAADNAKFLTSVTKQQKPSATASSIYISGERVLIYGLVNPSPAQIQILLNYAKAIRNGTLSGASTSNVQANDVYPECNPDGGRPTQFLQLLFNDSFNFEQLPPEQQTQHFQKLVGDIKGWAPFAFLVPSRNIADAVVNGFAEALATFIIKLKLTPDDIPLFQQMIEGIGNLCQVLYSLAKDPVRQSFTDSEISETIANLTVVINSWTSCLQVNLADKCTPPQIKDAFSNFFNALPTDVPGLKAFLTLLKTAAALINSGHQVVLTILTNKDLSLQPILVTYSSDLSAIVFTISTVGNDPMLIANDIQHALDTAEQFSTQIQGTVNQRILIDVPSEPVNCDALTNLPTRDGYTVVIPCNRNGTVDVKCSPPNSQCQEMGRQLGLPVGQSISTLYGSTQQSSSAGTTIEPPPDPSESGPAGCLGPTLCLTA